ncbi:MAG: enoyl-CoA hydratase/isomerase family protein [Planctomycetota bacterium]|nr:enoyl-CoA hydratase/isomerase family protein [Planctomycetota bacterium]
MTDKAYSIDTGNWRVIVFDSPHKRNAFSESVSNAAEEAVSKCTTDGKGLAFYGMNGYFCSGADRSELVSLDERGAFERSVRAQKMCFDIYNGGFPSLSLVRGHCIGKGFEVALACDLIVAESNAFFQFPEVLLGFEPGSGGVKLLEERIGKTEARELLRTGRRFDAVEASDKGICMLSSIPADPVSDNVLASFYICGEVGKSELEVDREFAQSYAKQVVEALKSGKLTEM